MKNTGKNVLIIEDEETLRNLVVEKFNKEGLNTLVAKNGLEGLNMALENHPDIILLDLLLPTMDGIKMLEKLREDGWGKGAVVIILSNLQDTGKVSIADVSHGGVYEYVTKADCEISDLVKIVKNKLGV